VPVTGSRDILDGVGTAGLHDLMDAKIYERTDGAEPHWRLLYTNHYPGRISETGLRGLDADCFPSGWRRSFTLSPSRAALRGSCASIRATAAKPPNLILPIFFNTAGACWSVM